MNVKKVKLLNLNTNEEIPAKLEYTTTIPTKIILSFDDKVVEAQADNLLDTLIDIRKQLNEKYLDILVNGSRRDISSSKRIREAFSGEKTYFIRQFGIGAGYEDILNIFDPIQKKELYTIDEQKEYHNLWLKSLEPSDGEREEAKNHPNGWVYRFDRPFSKDETVPPEAIVGAWEVSSQGDLTGKWKSNKNYVQKEIREKNN